MARVFWEWRHKVMTFFFTATVALATLASWIYDRGLSPGTLAAPLFLGAIVAAVAWFFDWRIARILDATYDTAKSIEQRLQIEPGPYQELVLSRGKGKSRVPTMTEVLRCAYGFIGLALLVLAVLELCFPIGGL